MNPRLLRFAAVPAIGVVLFGGRLAAAETLEDLEKIAGEWVKVRLETVRLESDWKFEQGILGSTVESLQERAAALEEKRANLAAKTAKDREETETLRARSTSAANDLQIFETRLKTLSDRLLALRPNLPPRLADALEMSFRSLSENISNPGERMQLAMNVLNRCTQFNHMITAGEEVLTIDQNSRAFETIYWGLSHGYALDRAAGKVWLGSPGPQGWRWEPQPSAVAAVTRLIAIVNDKADPDFVAVPARLVGGATPLPDK